MVDFRSLLNKPAESVERPPVMPAGMWYGQIKTPKLQEARNFEDPATGEKMAQVAFPITVQEVGPGVDSEEGRRFYGRTVSKEFNVPSDGSGDWALRMFLESLGISSVGKTLETMIPEATGVSVQFIMDNTPSKKDPAMIFANVGKVSKRQ